LTTAGGATAFNALTVGGNLNASANGLISDNGNVAVVGTTTLAAGPGNDITLDNADDFGGAVTIVSGQNVTLNDINALTVGGTVNGNLVTTAGAGTAFNALTVGGNLNASANGLISDNGNVAVVGTTTLAAGPGNDITLDNADDFGGPVSIVSGHNVTLNDINALTVGGTVSGNLLTTAGGTTAFNALTVGGNLNASANGLISDNGNVAVVGTTTLAAGPGNDITLDNADDFGGAVNIVSAQNVTLNDINALTVGGTVSGNLLTTAGGATAFNALTVAGNLNASANGLISDNGNVAVVGTTTLAAAAGNDITLDNADDFGGAVNIVSGHNVTLNDINALTVGGTVSGNLLTTAGGATAFNTLTVAGNLNASANGLISDNGNVAVVGTTTLAARPGNDITLDNADDFGGAVTIVSGQNVTLNDINALTVGGTVNGNLLTTAGAGTAFNTLTVGGNLNASANGLISDNGNVAVVGTTTLAAGAGNDITLDNADDFGGAVTIVSGQNVTLNDINALTVGGTVNGNLVTTAGGITAFNTLTVGGSLNASANGLISDSGNLAVAGTTTLAAGAGNDITLDNADDFGAAVNIVSGHNVTLNDINALTMGGTVSGNLLATAAAAATFNTLSVAGALTATAGGAINENGPVTVGALASFTSTGTGASGDIALNNAGNNFGSIGLSSANGSSVSVAEASDTALDTVAVNAGSLAVTSGGDLTQVAGKTVTVGGSATFTAPGGKSIVVANVDGLGNPINTFNGPVNFVSSGSGNLQNVSISDTTAFDIAALTVNGALSVNSGAAVTQSGNIGANGLEVTAVGPVTLGPGAADPVTWPLANHVDTVAGKVTGAGNAFSFIDQDPLTVGTVNGVTGISTVNGAVTLTADSMNIAAQINTGGRIANVLLQPRSSSRGIHAGAGEQAGVLNLTEEELRNVTGHILQVGNHTVPSLQHDGTILKPDSVDQLLLVSSGTTIQVLSEQVAGLSAVTIPAVKLDTTSFSIAMISSEDAALLLPLGAIGTLWLQLPFPPPESEEFKIESLSKWTSGRVAAAGTTTGPQSPK
jgi:hypothetical protein